MTPSEKRQRALYSPEYLDQLYDHLRQQLPIDAQVLLESSEISIALDEDTVVLLTLQEPWVMEPRHRMSVISLVQSIATEFDIECIGIVCGEQCWAAIQVEDGWLVTKTFQGGDGEPIALPPATRLHCQGWSCDWKDDCACHAAFRRAHQQGFLNHVKMISPNPEACRHFTPAIKINPNI